MTPTQIVPNMEHQVSIRNNDKGNDIVVKPLNYFSFKSVTPIQTKFKTPTKRNNKSLHQQSLLLDDTDFTSDEEQIYFRIPKHNSHFLPDKTLHEGTVSTLKNQSPLGHQNQHLQFLYKQTFNLPHTFHTLYSFMIDPSSNTKITIKASFFQTNNSLDFKTLQQKQSQDPVHRNVHSWITRNEKPEFLTPLITGTPFLHAYYKRFSQLFIDDSTNLISLYTKNTLPSETTKITSKYITRYSWKLSTISHVLNRF